MEYAYIVKTVSDQRELYIDKGTEYGFQVAVPKYFGT